MVVAGWGHARSAEPQVRPTETLVIPQIGVVTRSGKTAISLLRVDAQVEILDTTPKKGGSVTADTTLTLHLQTTGKSSTRCEIVVPVPRGAQLVHADGSKPTGRNPSAFGSLSDAYCRNAAIRNRSPALLEFYGYVFLRLREIEILPGGSQSVTVRYRRKHPAAGTRRDYVLPKSELLSYRIPWTISATIRSGRGIAAVYSASHPIARKRDGKTGALTVTVQGNATAEPGPFQMSWLHEADGIPGSVFVFPAEKDRDGYFLLLLAVSGNVRKSDAQKREVTVVIDRSASTKGKRLAQIRGIANTVLDNLRPGEKFNIITYNEKVRSPRLRSATQSALGIRRRRI